jgi:phosphate-selective porin OprO/OprP
MKFWKRSIEMKAGWKLKSGLLLALCVGTAYADDNADDRIAQLQKMLEQQQKAMQEQQWQMKAMAEELKGLQQSRADDKGKSEGSPVMAVFKDGLSFEDGSGNWKLQINGRVQADYRFQGNNEWSPTYTRNTAAGAEDDGAWDSFSIRRARLGASFTFLKDFTARVEGEYSNEAIGNKATTAMTYGYLDFARWKGARIRMGQFKPFFGLERSESTNFIDFAELSLATSNGPVFTSTYDRGLMVFGDPLPWLNYNVYVVNGSAQNNDDINIRKDIGGRVNANFAQLADIKNAVIHVGASASDGSIGYTNQAANKGTLKGYTEGAGSSNYGKEFFSVSSLTGFDNGPDRTRWGVETALAYGPVKLQAEYIDANFEGKYKPAATILGYDNDITAWYASLSWLVTGESWADSYKSGIFGRMKPKSNFDTKDGWGALELDLRYSKFDASDFQNMLVTNAVPTTNPVTVATGLTGCVAKKTCNVYTSEAEAWTVGAKWILTPNARILLNYVHTSFDDPVTINRKTDDSVKEGILRAQFDF